MKMPNCPLPNLLQTLRQYRTDQAYIRAIPPSTVFSNRLLTSIVSARPTTLGSLSKLHGIGPTRYQNYGRDIVRFVNLDLKAKTDSKMVKIGPKLVKLNALKRGGKNTGSTHPARKKRGKKASNLSSRSKIVARSNVVATPKKAAMPCKPKFVAPQHCKPPIVTSRFFPENPAGGNLNETQSRPSVYILELDGGRVYVGSSKDVPRRLSQHAAGSGSAYTRIYRPTGVQLPRLGNVEGDGDAAERDETLRYMMLRGVHFVRGWKFARVVMPPEEFDEAEANIRELYDLCRKCGFKGHFCTYCRATFDRLGNPVG
jgi:predicted GIY-YIG superfamily endonuclease